MKLMLKFTNPYEKRSRTFPPENGNAEINTWTTYRKVAAWIK